MALLFCDNFENWTSTNFAYPGPWVVAGGIWGTSDTFNNVNHTISGVYQTHNATSSYLTVGFPDTATIVCNIRLSLTQVHSNDTGAIVWFMDGGTEQCSLRFQPNGFFSVYRGITTAKLGQSTNFFQYDVNNYLDIELKIGIHNTTGTVELRVNGVVEINLTNQNTRGGSNNYANVVRIGRHTQTQAARSFFKQFILMDTTGSEMNDFIGPVDVSSLRPNADGNYTAWTALAGDRWDAVNDAVTDGDATYVHAATATNKVSFAMTDLPAGVTDVFGVFGQSQLKREQGTTRITRMFVRAGGTDQAIGSTLAVGPTYAFRNAVATVNPHTAAAWTPAEINALELGMEITT